jgi:type VI secretion system protein ImpB
MSDSKQHWLDRNRPPRVQITYDVETGGAMQKKEIPFVVGVLADLGGTKPGAVPPALRDRKFIEVDRDNFDGFLASINPGIGVAGYHAVDGSDEIRFEKLEHFHPDSLVQRVKELNDLLRVRQDLNDLLAKVDGNDALVADLETRIP